MPDTVKLTYELPPVVSSVRKGWLATLRFASFSASLFTLLSLFLFTTIQSRNIGLGSDPQSITVLLALAYLGIILNSSTVITSFLLIDRLGDLPYRCSSEESGAPLNGFVLTSSTTQLLKLYGAGPSWYWVLGHWFVSFLSGILCVSVEILLFAWLHEAATSVKIVVACAVGFMVVPLILLVPHHSRQRPIDSSQA
ncbi:hypothetical protein HGRIS_006823 [Hohenbuehelia grisea]|uniref:Uncharacterized protein n=1 Tax=Hohenbuehelia grisea TaxID=104357 RepID=A0ABR3JAH6_9AGAR